MALEPRARVLVADDNELFRLLLGSMLSNAGIDVTGARTGAEALALAPQIRPDAALLDWRMPGGGLTLARALIAEYCMADRVIMITALDDPRDRRAAHKAGIAWYLVKPPDRDELMAAVRAAISGRPGPQHQRASGSSQPQPRSNS
jgi:DNA-binding response OmpR family regulator